MVTSKGNRTKGRKIKRKKNIRKRWKIRSEREKKRKERRQKKVKGVKRKENVWISVRIRRKKRRK